MAASKAQNVTINGSTAGGTIAVAMGSTTAGNAIHIAVECFEFSAGLVTLTATDTQGNTYTQRQETGDLTAGVTVTVLTAQNIVGGANTVTINIGLAVTRAMRGVITEWTGVTTTPVDANPVFATGTGTTATATTTGTLSQADEVGIVSIFGSTGVGTISVPATWTDSGSGLVDTMRSCFLVVSATTALVPASTLSSSQKWFAHVLTFKASGGGGGVVKINSVQGGPNIGRPSLGQSILGVTN